MPTRAAPPCCTPGYPTSSHHCHSSTHIHRNFSLSSDASCSGPRVKHRDRGALIEPQCLSPQVWNVLEKLERLSREELLEISRPFLTRMVRQEEAGRGSQAPCTALSHPLPPETTYQPPKLLAQLMSLRPTKSKETRSSNSGLSSQRSGS